MSENGDKLAMWGEGDGLRQLEKMASMFIEAGYAPKGMTENQLILVAQAGRELGMGPTTAMRQLYVVNNRVALQGGAMLGLIQQSGKCARMRFDWDKGDKAWEVTMARSDFDLEHTERFSFAMAEQVKVKENQQWIKLTEKFVWKSYPKTMLYWRALSACARKVFADVIEGMYLPEELGAEVEVVDDDSHEVRVLDVQTEDTDEQSAEPEEHTDEAADIVAQIKAAGETLGYSKAKVQSDIASTDGTADQLACLFNEYDEDLAASYTEPAPEAGNIEQLQIGGTDNEKR